MSLTKAISPTLRIGAIAARGPVAQRIAGLRVVDDFFVSRVLQEATVDFLSGSAWPTHLRSLGAPLRRRRDALMVAVARHLPDVEFDVPLGGTSIWIALPRGVDDEALVQAAASLGVRFQSGRRFFIGEASRPFVRLAFAAIDENSMEEAMERTSNAFASTVG